MEPCPIWRIVLYSAWQNMPSPISNQVLYKTKSHTYSAGWHHKEPSPIIIQILLLYKRVVLLRVVSLKLFDGCLWLIIHCNYLCDIYIVRRARYINWNEVERMSSSGKTKYRLSPPLMEYDRFRQYAS